MKKYELLEDDQISVDGNILYRIRALRSFSNVKEGDLGGYIEKESNLSHDGGCWVYDNACVYGSAYVFGGSARVFDDAQVYDDAEVSGFACVYGDAQVSGNALVGGFALVTDDAQVSGNARVYGDARVIGDAQVSGNARVYGDARLSHYANVSTRSDLVWFSNVGTEYGTLTVYKGKDGTLWAIRGCFIGTVEEFLAKSKRVHNERVHREYQLLIEVAKSRILGGNR